MSVNAALATRLAHDRWSLLRRRRIASRHIARPRNVRREVVNCTTRSAVNRNGTCQSGDGAALIQNRLWDHIDHGDGDFSRMMLSALDLARRIEDGSLTPAGALDLCAQTIGLREADLGAFTIYDIARARMFAERGTAALSASPLRGLAVGIKDVFASPTDA